MAATGGSLLSRFQGCLMGVLVGDCLGAPFEGQQFISKAHLNRYFNQLLDPTFRHPFKKYTDDTIMTKSVALSLTTCKGYQAEDMAKRFVDEFRKDPNRGYGSTVGEVFKHLHQSDYADPYGPAQLSFGGQGSLGNGAAMRVAPIPLLYHQDSLESLVNVTAQSSRLTHHHKVGILGAVVEALAIKAALREDGTRPIECVQTFLDGIIHDVAKLEGQDPYKPVLEAKKHALDEEPELLSYAKKLQVVKAFLERDPLPTREEIVEHLGVHVSAYRSVPTAIFCYLAAQKAIPEVETDNIFQRTIQYSYSLGGDTDTIGAMAGAIAGAHLGLEGIPSALLNRCEAPDEVLNWAQELYTLHQQLQGQKKNEAVQQ